MDEGTGHRYKAMTLASRLGITVIVYDRSIIVVGACRIAPRSSLGALAELIWASQGSSRVGIAGASVTRACKRKRLGRAGWLYVSAPRFPQVSLRYWVRKQSLERIS